MDDIRSSLENALRYLTEHPDEARYTDSPAVAILEEGLRCRVGGPSDAAVITDMPESVGGSNTAPSPGWLFRAALAACVATLVAMEAARTDTALEDLEVTVDSESDDRGILGMDPSVPAGPLSVGVRVKAKARHGHAGRLRTIVERAARLCPVWDVVARDIPISLEIEET
jgi:uncharacterized OsmC-like protein